MFKWLKDLVDSIKKVFRKSTIFDHIDSIVQLIDENVVFMLDATINMLKDHSEIDDPGKLMTVIRKKTKINNSKPLYQYKELKQFILDCRKILTDITPIVKKEMPDLVSKEQLTNREASILKIIDDMNIIVSYTNNLLLYSIYDISEKIGNQDSYKNVFGRKDEEELMSLINSYVNLVNYYYGNTDIVKKIEKIPDIQVSLESISNIFYKENKNTLKLPITSNFIGNPIYSLRMWWVDREIDRYEALKEKKNLYSLKLLALKEELNNAGGNNEKIQKQIEYYEDKIQRIEYKIRKIEDI